MSVGAFAGFMVALLIVAIFGIWGILSPGGAKGLDEPGKLIIEEETGTKYIYDANTKKMLPVANYASALLALSSDKIDRRSVSRKSLDEFARGPMIGIPGAPDSLPDAEQLVRGPWSVCVREATAPTASSGSTAPSPPGTRSAAASSAPTRPSSCAPRAATGWSGRTTACS
ncbi:type VII secretion protein EccB [Actinomadura sp. CNU-125]|uniref:type VII secretion protein EccB n=1 Tax=Actinomadura sp. CNU-125 TaxID=1904961 RepID=UPI0021CC7410|nr:type VII secretion protein EccB [Actinomadura sp. CNU-125]